MKKSMIYRVLIYIEEWINLWRWKYTIADCIHRSVGLEELF